MSDFTKLLKAKRAWEVIPFDTVLTNPEVAEVLQRGLHIRHLELPVGSFIKQTAKFHKAHLGEVGIRLLGSNFKDEDRHDRQLNVAYKAFKGCNPEQVNRIEAEGDVIIKKWLKLGETNYPVLIALAGEAGVFIPLLTLFRRICGTQMATLAQEISRDESLHITTNSLLCKQFNYKFNKEIKDLIDETLDWITKPLEGLKDRGRYYNPQNYFELSRAVLNNKTFDLFEDTQIAIVPAFFEVANTNLPRYGSSK